MLQFTSGFNYNMLLFNHRQTGKDPIDTCIREQMGHKRWNSFQRVYLFVSCHGLNQGGYYFRMDSAPIPVNEERKSQFEWIMQNQPLGKEKSWSLLKFYWQFCSKGDIVLLKCSILKPDVWYLNIHTCRTLNRPMKVYWKTIGNTRIFFKNAKYHSAF